MTQTRREFIKIHAATAAATTAGMTLPGAVAIAMMGNFRVIAAGTPYSS